MKSSLIIISILFLLFSCKGNINENENLEKETPNTSDRLDLIPEPDKELREAYEKSIVHKLNTFCFFKLDDKYSVEKDSLVIMNWLNEKSLAIIQNDTLVNIFNQEGGGPNGAQWNPSTDLYIGISLGSDEFTEIPKLYINGKLFEEETQQQSPNLVWYVLNQDFWNKEVIEIDSPEYLREIENGNFKIEDNLLSGEIFKIEITYKDESLIKYFHAAYGE